MSGARYLAKSPIKSNLKKAQMNLQRKISTRFWQIEVWNLYSSTLLCVVFIAFAAGAAAACGGADGGTAERAATLDFKGLITDVEAGSLLEIRSITVVAADGGEAITLFADERAGDGGFGHFTPSHAREHMIRGIPVAARYRWDGEVAVVVGMEDAEGAAASE